MSLVGDVIVGARDLFPDPCASLQSPSAVVTANAGTYFSGGQTVYVKVTQGTQWGETATLQEYTATSVSNFNVSAVIATSFLATFVRLYFSTVAGGEDQYVELQITTPANTQTVSVSSVATVGQGFPPGINRAFVPDSDGNILSSARLYSWINEGLNMVGQYTGGIRDVTGVPSVVGQAQYQLINQWVKIDNNFYKGYPFVAGRKQQIFRHSSVVGLTGVGTMNMASDRQMVEVWPQSDATAGNGTLTSNINNTQTTIPFTPGANGFVLPFGLLLIGQYPPTTLVGQTSCELCYYSNLGGSSISQMTRGMGGTQPQNWLAGTNVQECNIYFTGKRQPQLYQRGQSAFTFTCPPGYEDAIRTYLLYRFKDAEQNTQESQSKLKLFREICETVNKTQQVNGPHQLQIGGTGGVEIAAGLGSPFGGVVIPALLFMIGLASMFAGSVV